MDKDPRPNKIIAVVEGGVLQDIYCSDHEATLVLYDFDNLQEQGVEFMRIEEDLQEATAGMKIIPQGEIDATDFEEEGEGA